MKYKCKQLSRLSKMQTEKRKIQYPLDSVRAVLMGAFVGDALGAPFEGARPDDIPHLDDSSLICRKPLRYTDDTQMNISVFEEMLEHGSIDPQSLRTRFLSRYQQWRSYGGGMLALFNSWLSSDRQRVEANQLWEGQGSFGNGAAMRSGSIALFFKEDEMGEMMEEVRKNALITHTHIIGITGAVLLSSAVLCALNRRPLDRWPSMFFSLPIDSIFKIKFEKVMECITRRCSAYQSAREIGNGSDALESVPAAIYAVMRNSESFVDAVTFAIAMGGDTDTIAAMTGAIAGARLGYHSIPREWIDALENEEEGREYVLSLARRSVERCQDDIKQ
jgi:poly(ADP-ribose) glycohydrolase ARH3